MCQSARNIGSEFLPCHRAWAEGVDAICRDGHEGVIAKRAHDHYRGARSKSWLKVKCLKRQEFIIGGWSPSSKRREFASLLLGARENGKLVYRGRVYGAQGEELVRQEKVFDRYANRIWNDLVPKGSADVKAINDLPGGIEYVVKSLPMLVNWDQCIIPDEFWATRL